MAVLFSALTSSAPAALPSTATDGKPVCVVCLDAPQNLVFQPCSHLCTCATCGASLSECPMCRNAISGSLKIFSA